MLPHLDGLGDGGSKALIEEELNERKALMEQGKFDLPCGFDSRYVGLGRREYLPHCAGKPLLRLYLSVWSASSATGMHWQAHQQNRCSGSVGFIS
jgi:hypothetical protein